MKLLLSIFAIMTAVSAYGQDVSLRYLMTNSSYVRAAAMGQAYTAVQDELESNLYNPAGLINSRTGKLHFYFNPLGAADAFLHRDALSHRPALSSADATAALGLLLRAVSFSPGPVQFVLQLTEELPNNPNRKTAKPISTQGVLDWNFHTASVRLKFAKQISMGATFLLFTQSTADNQQSRAWGASYGVHMLPASTFSVGISLFNLPESVRSVMTDHYRIGHHSVNVGMSWQPVPPLRLTMDFRNVTQEDSLSSGGNLHGGLELIPVHFLALRTGYYRNDELGRDVLSVGLGLTDFRRYALQRERFVLSKILLNYALQVKRAKDDTQLVHHLTFLLRI